METTDDTNRRAEEFGTVFVADVDVEWRSLIADGATVVVEQRMRATLAHGGRFANDYCFVFELVGGRIHRVLEYMDTALGHALFRTPGRDEEMVTRPPV